MRKSSILIPRDLQFGQTGSLSLTSFVTTSLRLRKKNVLNTRFTPRNLFALTLVFENQERNVLDPETVGKHVGLTNKTRRAIQTQNSDLIRLGKSGF